MECQRRKFSPHGGCSFFITHYLMLSALSLPPSLFLSLFLCFLIKQCVIRKERKKKRGKKKMYEEKGNFQNCCSREPRDHPLIAVRRNVANDRSKKQQKNPLSLSLLPCIWQINSTFVIYLSKMFFSRLMRVKKLRCSFARVVARDTNVLVTAVEKLCVSSWWRTERGEDHPSNRPWHFYKRQEYSRKMDRAKDE